MRVRCNGCCVGDLWLDILILFLSRRDGKSFRSMDGDGCAFSASAPTLGFLGSLSVVNNLVMEGNYYLVAVVLLSLTLIANGYLRIIKAIYFTSSPNIFDRADRGIYVFLFVNLIIVIVALLHPRLLMNDFEKMLITVF